MKTMVPYYYKYFKCIASKCTDTCCAGWEIIIDDETYKQYKNVPGEFGERLKSNLKLYEDDAPGFVLQNNKCSFLNKTNLCDIYTELGENSLCYTCRTFPKVIEEYGSIREIGLSLSCPEAARLILQDSKQMTFEFLEDGEIVSTCDDIFFDTFMQLISARKIALDILQNPSIDLNHRIALLISFAHDIQEKINEYKLSEIADITNKYSNEDYQKELITIFDKYKLKQGDKYHNMLKCMNIYINIDSINDNYSKIIEHAINCFHKTDDLNFYEKQYDDFNDYYKNKTYEFEHLLVYSVFRYFMKATYDDELYSKVALSAMSYLIVKELDVVRWIDNNYNFDLNDQIDIMHMYSKEIEHCEENLYHLEEMFNTNKLFDLKQLLILIMN
jgi:lysine-N-methylase